MTSLPGAPRWRRRRANVRPINGGMTWPVPPGAFYMESKLPRGLRLYEPTRPSVTDGRLSHIGRRMESCRLGPIGEHLDGILANAFVAFAAALLNELHVQDT